MHLLEIEIFQPLTTVLERPKSYKRGMQLYMT